MIEEHSRNTETAGARAPAVSLSGITKRFGDTVANDRVDLEIRPGEVHALLGENGAGKSTLSNVLTGLYRPDEGSIRLDGELVSLHSPGDAIDAGIGMVHQHFRLVPTFTVAENLVLGHRGPLRRRETEERLRLLGERYGLLVDPTARIWQLSVGEQQRVEILKALERNARVLILDEPTAVLTPVEAAALFVTLRSMAAEGKSVLFISHKLDEVMAVSDRVTILRDGRNVGTVEVESTSARELARLMVGRDVVFDDDDRNRDDGDRAVIDPDRVVLEVVGLSADGDRGQRSLDAVTLAVRAGEIVAVVGVAGNGQRELAETICATRRRTAGSVRVDGQLLVGNDPREAIDLGVGHVPEDRLHTGLAAGLSIEENLVLKSYRRPPFSRGPFLVDREIRSRAEHLIERFGIRTPRADIPTRMLSGGNVQKVVLAREFSGAPLVLVAASPTRGLDVGAIESVRELLREAARNGVGVLLITEDLDEALALADRLLVMFGGRIVGEVSRADAGVETLGLMMGGIEVPT